MTEREKFEKWCKANKYTALYFSDNMYFDKATQMAWKAWQAAKATSFTLPERMDYELHGDKVINDPFADGYNECLSDVIAMNEEYANSTVSDGWIPVSERLPYDDELVLVYDSEGTHWRVYTLRAYKQFFDKFKCATHWMPLPKAPEQK